MTDVRTWRLGAAWRNDRRRLVFG